MDCSRRLMWVAALESLVAPPGPRPARAARRPQPAPLRAPAGEFLLAAGGGEAPAPGMPLNEEGWTLVRPPLLTHRALIAMAHQERSRG